MTMRYIFHLSIPVSDLALAREFYTAVLLGRPGREEADWMDILLWGHQITLQERPNEVLQPPAQGKRHFGVVLPWSEWEQEATRLQDLNTEFVVPPQVLGESTPEEHAKFFLQDPSHNLIEVKAYRDFPRVLGAEDRAYGYSDS